MKIMKKLKPNTSIALHRHSHAVVDILPPESDSSIEIMAEKPDVTYSDLGGCKDQIEKIREVVEMPLLHPEKFTNLGIDPPKGVLLYGPPGTGKTSLVTMIAKNMLGDYFSDGVLSLNASDDRGLFMINNTIYPFCKKKTDSVVPY